ncbi:MFS transporter [Adhaeribacter arboris]|uniref:MFS transporter n=1 Tax=Adhaeribacter arboris TaxID=2072846 RepID=A0A2T2YIY0_9BACT|nr:MFS transporter [Adhaeribacter arboris]PSR55461.1 MFS transporter [Adhaeribacter arboris]
MQTVTKPVIIGVGKYRWTICSLVFFATTINYLDRAVISLLKSNLEAEFRWTETDYSNIVIAFQLSYALGMIGVGRLIDKLGTKLGYALSITLWSVAAIGHALVKSTFGFVIARSALGITEAGNFPAAIKTVAEWFPKRERALATGIFNSGTNVGAIIAPLTVPFIAVQWGWQWAFILTGLIGFVWLILWFVIYEVPAKHAKLSKTEFDFIHSDIDTAIDTENAGKSASWISLLGFRQTWAFALGKFLTDPVWWFYLFWLPAFLKAEYGVEGTAMALPVALVYTLSTFGSIGGGWLPLKFIKNGMPVFKARKTSMLIYAFCALPVLFSQYLGTFNMWLAVFIIGFAASAHQAWSANIFTTVSDMFPKKAIGSITGIGGMFGGLGGMLIAKLAGLLFDHYKALGTIEIGYYIMFFICGSAYLLAWGIMHVLAPKMKQVVL